MKRVLRWTAIRINRRQALRGASTAAFGVLAGVAVGRPARADVPPCTGPNGTGRCPSVHCITFRCAGYGLTRCGFFFGACPTPNGACWTSSFTGGTCCDCLCTRESTRESPGPYSGGPWPVPPRSFYCYCFAP